MSKQNTNTDAKILTTSTITFNNAGSVGTLSPSAGSQIFTGSTGYIGLPGIPGFQSTINRNYYIDDLEQNGYIVHKKDDSSLSRLIVKLIETFNNSI